MGRWTENWRIRYQHQLDPSFAREVMAIPEGAALARCIQCGTCAGTCPVSHFMDYTPRRIVAMTRAGMRQDVLSCFTIWLCASCYACTAACPQEIPITEVMYALKRLAIREGTYPKGFPVPILAREFYKVVAKRGRNSEGEVTLRMYLRAGPWRHVRKAGLGLKLYIKGRMGIVPDRIRQQEQLARLLHGLEARLSPQAGEDRSRASLAKEVQAPVSAGQGRKAGVA
ncbi:MAG: 4Fe-4S dicluster domain-containing protein [Thermoanaerobaculum sp.]|nr:4Fe-4S dicluster domain-containing protein [Thermoanaerobaculum sp.]